MKKSTVLFFLVFLGGVICANVLGVAFGRELGAMNEYFTNRYLYANIQGRELFPFLFYRRVPSFCLLFFLSVGIYGTFIVDGYLCCIGFSVGFLSVIAIMNSGVKGILLMFGFYLPQWFFYAPMLMLWRYGLQRYKGSVGEYGVFEQKKKRRMKLAAALLPAPLLLLLGLFTESYVNPVLLQKVIRLIG